MKILVTGGAGFIGSNIVDELILLNYEVVIIDNLSTGLKENINKKAKFYNVDIKEKNKIFGIFKKEKPNMVIHTAAQVDVVKSVKNPIDDLSINIIGSLNILEACGKYEVSKIIFSSSGGAIYGECKTKPANENTFANPLSPYGITKLAVENYIKFYANLHNFKYTILRYSNVYGKRQGLKGEAGVISIFAKRMLKNENIFIYGNGKQQRDYVNVQDVVNANIKAIKNADNKILNISSNSLVSINELVKHMAKITGYKKKPIYKPLREGEIFRSCLCNKKAKTLLKWKNSVNFYQGLLETVNYFKNFLETK